MGKNQQQCPERIVLARLDSVFTGGAAAMVQKSADPGATFEVVL